MGRRLDQRGPTPDDAGVRTLPFGPAGQGLITYLILTSSGASTSST